MGLPPSSLHSEQFARLLSKRDRVAANVQTKAEAGDKFTARLEREMHKQFSQWLDLNGLFYIHSRTDKRTTQRKGLPDYFVIGKETLVVELKTETGRLSSEQQQILDELSQRGVTCMVTSSVVDAIELVKCRLL
jgi:hypothetical protein